ncbi:hypothetical protein [Mycobacterium tilburgii]|uniref:hypothetical protein n=1 Tax=Mycobacterium tilburgii TaxID=44467 RepID=UPI0021B322C6|nr:hypothetical protein [Mycobacterium tilburgii]
METDPIVRATSLTAHGSLASDAGGSASSATAAAGTAATIQTRDKPAPPSENSYPHAENSSRFADAVVLAAPGKLLQ